MQKFCSCHIPEHAESLHLVNHGNIIVRPSPLQSLRAEVLSHVIHQSSSHFGGHMLLLSIQCTEILFPP